MTSEGNDEPRDPILAALIAAETSALRVQGIEVSTVTLPVRHTVNWRESGGQDHLATTRFLSLQAVTFESPVAAFTGMTLEIDVELPEGKHLVGTGRVQELFGDDLHGWIVTVRFGASHVSEVGGFPCPTRSNAVDNLR